MSGRYARSETAGSDDFNDYDIISDADPPSLGSSIADLHDSRGSLPRAPGDEPQPAVREIVPSQDARVLYETAGMTADDVQVFVQRSVRAGGDSGASTAKDTIRGSSAMAHAAGEKTVRVYTDGVFDVLHVGTALRLRQAKLAFPSVQLLVGPFTDAQCRAHALPCTLPHVERSELLRHVRWVDEVLHDAPVVLDDAFLKRHRIDYVAIEEGVSVDPTVGKARLAGYDRVKGLGKAIVTRRTRNVVASTLSLIVPIPPAVPETAVPTPATLPRTLETMSLNPPASASGHERAMEPPPPTAVAYSQHLGPETRASRETFCPPKSMSPRLNDAETEGECPPYVPSIDEDETPEPQEDFLA